MHTADSQPNGAAAFVNAGYLSIETHEDHPGLLRLVLSGHSPDPEPTLHRVRRIRYVARFNDREAGLMHTHEALKRHLLDPDTHLYRVSLERAIAAIESLGLSHRRIYLDPDLSAATRAQLDQFAARYRSRRQRLEAFFQTLGYIGVGILLFNLFVLSFP